MVRVERTWIPAVRAGSPTLLFLHEGLGSLALWRDFPPALALATGFGALTYSRLGNGFSEPLAHARTPSYMHDEALVELPRLMDEERVERAVLVGHSDGASIAILYAAHHPDRVAALVLEAPHVFVEDLSVRSIATIRTQYESSDLRERIARHHTNGDATFYGWNDIWLSPEFRDWNIEQETTRLRAPSFLIQGAADEYGTLAQIDAIAHRSPAPVDRLILANCGHTPHRDRPQFVVSAIAGWLEALA